MPDIPGNTSTTTSIVVGGTLTDQLEVFADHDWIRIELTAGQKITITLDGITLEDPYLRLRDSSGGLLAENDDINLGLVRDSKLVFTAPTTGIYYIDVGAWDEAYAGTYELSVQIYTPPTVWTYEEVAGQLAAGYWGGDVHAFDVTQGGTITVNVTALTSAGQNLARNALALWSDIIGVSFVEVSSGGQITFDDNESGAFSDGIWSNGNISSTHVNVSTSWLTSYGTSLNSYSFHTYIHEIGHALGLGHAGMYNETANYADDALYLNDSWPVTVMSYFDQSEATYFANQGFTETFATTPMLADVRAMATLYGLSTTTRTGDTTYGFGNTSGRSVYNASVGTITAYTIFDSGGIDTINYSGFGNNQIIDLNPETFSNVGGGVGNVSIAFNTIIENAIGGSGTDQITGNSANNVLEGRGGNDTLLGLGGNDTLIGGANNDQLNGGDGVDTASYATASAAVTANLATGSATYSGATDTALVGIDTLISIENIFGSNFNDTLTGDSGANQIDGGGGNDTLIGGAGNDQLNGGDGVDTASYATASAAVTVNLATGSATYSGATDTALVGIDTLISIENIFGSNFNDTLTGDSGANQINGGGGNDTINGGGGTDALDGGAGDDRIVYDAADSPSLVTGGTGTDTLVVNNDLAPTGFNLAAQGFERAEVHQTDTGANPWSSIVRVYNANWDLVQRVTTNDDGSRIVVDYDVGNTVSTTEVWSTFNAQGQLSSVDQFFDNGTRTFINLDEANSQPWTQEWLTYDNLGRLSSHDVHYDNGTRTFINLDEANSQPWAQEWFTYDSLGRLSSHDVHYDNGTRTFINLDEADSEDWAQSWFSYDSLGRLDTVDVHNDDGSRTFSNFDQAETEPFSVSATLYDDQGSPYQQVITWDDGSTSYILL